jgi:Mce-associated membrane protein
MAVDAHSADTELSGAEKSPASDATEDVDRSEPAHTTDKDIDGDDVESADEDEQDNPAEPGVKKSRNRPAILSAMTSTPIRSMITAGFVVCIVLAGVAGWSSYRAYESHRVQQQRELFLQVGRQGAINLTTIDYHHAPEDVARILASSTGILYENFQQRAQPFVQLVQEVRAITRGTVTAAGLESVQGDEAQVLLAVKVERWVNDAQQEPNQFRMRIHVQRVGEDMKMANVEFVA